MFIASASAISSHLPLSNDFELFFCHYLVSKATHRSTCELVAHKSVYIQLLQTVLMCEYHERASDYNLLFRFILAMYLPIFQIRCDTFSLFFSSIFVTISHSLSSSPNCICLYVFVYEWVERIFFYRSYWYFFRSNDSVFHFSTEFTFGSTKKLELHFRNKMNEKKELWFALKNHHEEYVCALRTRIFSQSNIIFHRQLYLHGMPHILDEWKSHENSSFSSRIDVHRLRYVIGMHFLSTEVPCNNVFVTVNPFTWFSFLCIPPPSNYKAKKKE